MLSAIVAFGIALVVVIAVTPVVRGFAQDVGAVDAPGDRRVHAQAIPRLGGIALVVAFFAPLLALFGLETEVARIYFGDPLRIVALVAGGMLVAGLGVIDDVRGVRAWHKLWVQLAAAGIAYACGYRIDAIALPLIGHLDMGVFALPVTALWIAAIINALNLIDGLDGLAGGIAFFACVTNFAVGSINHDVLVMLLSASLGGAVLGFLLYNFNPASIFMGDSGAMFLGYVLATTGIMGSSVKSSTTVAILVPLIALGLPIMDTLFAMMRRFLERRPIFSPDQGHIHHQLLAMGITHRRAVLILYALSVLFATGAILISLGRNWQVGGAMLVLSVAVIGVVRSLGNFQQAIRRWRRRERIRPEAINRLREHIPDSIERLRSARDIAQLPDEIERFARQARLSAASLSASRAPRLSAFGWRDPTSQPATLGNQTLVFVEYPVPAAAPDAVLRFEWLTDQGEVSPEADILLQLVADAIEERLRRAERARDSVQSGHLRRL
ncbi:MAG: MraY family glycosyltransferase [Myxococcales bacterium]